MFTQRQLRAALDARIRAAGPRPGHGPAVAVLRDFDARSFARSVLDFASWLSPAARANWQGDFTRTVFLAGNPRNLAVRLPPSLVSPDGHIAWYAGGPRQARRELRLLLRAIEGELPPTLPGAVTLTVPGAPAAVPGHRWRATVATDGLSLPQYLVHVNHALAESVLTGILAPGDELTLHHTPDVPELPFAPAYLRVHQDMRDPERLRAFVALTDDRQQGAADRG
ncbi:DUF6182 family protein [Streptomyces huasconensis]|uniref:DUF6182 family protein n=1 Tax=Streptomyces huasconensis TaxID=1854574 RepID=UPI0033E65879